MVSLRGAWSAFVLAIVWLALIACSASAFSGSNHDRATGAALKGLVSPDALEAIKKANKAVDDPKRPYSGADHCDRNPGVDDATAFKNAARRVRDLKKQAIDAMLGCGTEDALKAIGEALHTIQDFYSHSNFVFLTDGEQSAARAAFDDPDKPNKPVPKSLRLTGYDGDPSKPLYDRFNPKDKDGKRDPYPHGLEWGRHLDKGPLHRPLRRLTPGDGAKPVTRNGVTRPAFEWAMEAAQKQCRDFTNDIASAVGKDLWDRKLAN